MPLQFDPSSYFQAYQQGRERGDAQKQELMDNLVAPLDSFAKMKQMQMQQERQAKLDKFLYDKNDRERMEFESKHGQRIDPNLEIGAPSPQTGQSRLFGNKPMATGRSMPMVEAFQTFRSRGMKPSEARPEFMGYMGEDDRKMYQEQFKQEKKDPMSLDELLAQKVQSGEMTIEQAMGLKKKAAEGPKQLPPPSVLAVNEGKAVARMLPEVEKALTSNESSFGPAMGRLGQVNPYNTTSQTLDARMRTASQAFGRFMEQGVLRKEDEEKYRRMFPQLSDTPQVAKNKLSIVRRMLAEQYQSQRNALGDSGYDVSGLGELVIPPSIFDQQEAPSSSGLIWQGRPLKDTPANRAWLAQQGGGPR